MFEKIKAFIAHLGFDVFLWFGIYQLAIKGPYMSYAFNLISFYTVVALFIMIVLTVNKGDKELAYKMMRNDNKFHNFYSYTTTMLEIAVLVAIGHIFIGTMLLILLCLGIANKDRWRKELENV